MLPLILAAAVCQAPTAEDLVFIRAIEESVMRMVPDARPSDPFRGLIRSAGDDDWRKRESASIALELIAEPRWLFWGRKSKDPEIAVRCNQVLRRLNRCPACKGSGSSSSWSEWACTECAGSGTVWPWSWLD